MTTADQHKEGERVVIAYKQTIYIGDNRYQSAKTWANLTICDKGLSGGHWPQKLKKITGEGIRKHWKANKRKNGDSQKKKKWCKSSPEKGLVLAVTANYQSIRGQIKIAVWLCAVYVNDFHVCAVRRPCSITVNTLSVWLQTIKTAVRNQQIVVAAADAIVKGKRGVSNRLLNRPEIEKGEKVWYKVAVLSAAKEEKASRERENGRAEGERPNRWSGSSSGNSAHWKNWPGASGRLHTTYTTTTTTTTTATTTLWRLQLSMSTGLAN